ncbi:MAG: hypothetical protein E6J90_17425 [Deltaproteobacteria bacterium]|nr:MAG: hypothetical protein E6J90_17425 [Deltaproteobacteria bacterium]
MPFQSRVVVEALQALERQLAVHRDPLAQVATALSVGHFAPALQAAEKLRDALAIVVSLYQRLYANVVPVDEMGSTVESVGELALRARRMVILTQLGRLRDLLREPKAGERARGWFVGDFASIDDVTAFFADQFAQINQIWVQYRQTHPGAAGISSTDRITLYRASVRVAQSALRELRNHPDLAYLLRAGLDAADWPDVLSACSEIVVALAVEVDVKSGRVPVVPVPPAQTPDATPPRKP